MSFDWPSIIKPSGYSTTLREVELFEVQLGFTLPDDYKDFLLRTNGGKVIVEHTIEVPELSADVFVHYFYPLSAASPFLGVIEARKYQEESKLCLRQAIQIAGDMGTGFFYLILAGSDRGGVYFIFKDDEPPVSDLDWDSWQFQIPEEMIEVSSNFDELGHRILENRNP
jgi:hypothetical protein